MGRVWSLFFPLKLGHRDRIIELDHFCPTWVYQAKKNNDFFLHLTFSSVNYYDFILPLPVTCPFSLFSCSPWFSCFAISTQLNYNVLCCCSSSSCRRVCIVCGIAGKAGRYIHPSKHPLPLGEPQPQLWLEHSVTGTGIVISPDISLALKLPKQFWTAKQFVKQKLPNYHGTLSTSETANRCLVRVTTKCGVFILIRILSLPNNS